MTTATIQPFCKKHNINIGCYDGYTVRPRIITERNIALYMYKNHFCLLSNSNVVSLSKAIEELKKSFKVVDKIKSDKHVKSFIKYEYKPIKVQSQITDKNDYDLETLRLIKLSLMLIL